jgi:hypothetical protein
MEREEDAMKKIKLMDSQRRKIRTRWEKRMTCGIPAPNSIRWTDYGSRHPILVHA